jgi:hypothetical protein
MTSIKKTRMTHDPGGKVRRALKNGVTGTAKFGGANGEYRYRLTRTWDAAKPRALFVLMNPSTADPSFDDPTVAKCCKYARGWGYGGIFVGNTFAYRATSQKELIKAADPVGPNNDQHLIAMAKDAATVIFAYGRPGHKALRPRGLILARLLVAQAKVKPYVLRLCDDGTPCHPLYLPQTVKPVLWKV